MVIKIDTKTKTKCFLAQRPIWRLKLRLVEWIWPKKSHKTKNTIFDLYRGHGPISLASEAGHCSNLKIVPDLASLDRFKFFQWFLCIIFNPLSPPNASFDLKIFHFHTSIDMQGFKFKFNIMILWLKIVLNAGICHSLRHGLLLLLGNTK